MAKVVYFKLFGVKIFHFFTMWCVWRRKEEGRRKEERRLDGNAPWQPVEWWMLTLQHVLQYQLYCSTTEKHCVMYSSMIITWHQTWTLNDKVVVLIPPTLDSIAFDRKRKKHFWVVEIEYRKSMNLMIHRLWPKFHITRSMHLQVSLWAKSSGFFFYSWICVMS